MIMWFGGGGGGMRRYDLQPLHHYFLLISILCLFLESRRESSLGGPFCNCIGTTWHGGIGANGVPDGIAWRRTSHFSVIHNIINPTPIHFLNGIATLASRVLISA
jgi:hypothetical protein